MLSRWICVCVLYESMGGCARDNPSCIKILTGVAAAVVVAAAAAAAIAVVNAVFSLFPHDYRFFF